MLKIILMCVFVFNASTAFAQKEDPAVLYNQAAQLYTEQKYEESQAILEKLIKDDPKFSEAVELLAYVYEVREEYAKSFKSYQQLLLAKDNLDILKTIKKNDQTLKLDEKSSFYVLKMANLFQSIKYKKLANTPPISSEAAEKYNIVSERLFNLTLINKYKVPEVLYHQSVLLKEKGHNREANYLLQEAVREIEKKERTKPGLSPDEVTVKKNIEYLLAQTYSATGYSDLASRYFQSIYNSNINDSLKSYAKMYLDTLSKSVLSGNVSLLGGYDTNPLTLTNSNLSTTSSEGLPTKGSYFGKSGNIYYSSDIKNNWAFFVSGTFTQNTYSDKQIDTADTNIFNLTGEVRYIHLPFGIFRFLASANRIDMKQDFGAPWTPFSFGYNLQPSLDKYFSWGVWNIGMAHTDTKFFTEGDSISKDTYGTTTITPWGINRFLGPSANFQLGKTAANGQLSNASFNRISISNQMRPTLELTLISTLGHTRNLANDATYTQEVYYFNNILLYDLSFLVSGLISKFSWSISDTITSNLTSDPAKRSVYTAGLLYYF
jgi:tetratricopeptide (TPR) repeat protein